MGDKPKKSGKRTATPMEEVLGKLKDSKKKPDKNSKKK